MPSKSSATPRFKAVALDMMGVVYPVGDDLRELILPFLRSEGCTLPDDHAIDAYRACSGVNVHRMKTLPARWHGAETAIFWTHLGYEAPHEAIEARLMRVYSLTPGALDFLELLKANGVPTFSVSNDVGPWAKVRRIALGIDEFFAGSVVSGELGVQKPEPAIYQALAKLLSCAPSDCLFVDDRAANVEGAVREGFAGALFDARGHETYDAVPDFKALTRYVGLE